MNADRRRLKKGFTTKARRGLVPRLRFSEFKNVGDWEVKKLGEVCEKAINGGTPSTKVEDYWNGDIPWITGADFTNQKIENVRRFITSDAIKNSSTNLIKKGTLLIVTRTGIGKLAIAPFNLAISQDITGFINKENIDTKYLFFLLDSINLEKFSQGTSINGIIREDLLSFPIPFPSLPEQQKIADCLSSLDDLISAEVHKLDALKVHKKGLMQELFPSSEVNHETHENHEKGFTTKARRGLVPRLRFQEFKNVGDWEVKKLGEVADVIAGQSPDGSNYNEKGEGIPFYQGKTEFGDIYLEKPNHWTTQITKLADKDDILMSVRAPVGALNISTDRICIGRGLSAIKAKQSKWFLYYSLLSIQKLIIGNGGSVFDSITRTQIENITILIPSLPEQQKIADCLSSLDDWISAQSRKIEVLKSHKAGLMQQLFPSVEVED